FRGWDRAFTACWRHAGRPSHAVLCPAEVLQHAARGRYQHPAHDRVRRMPLYPPLLVANADLDKDLMLQFALVRAVGLFEEAAVRVWTAVQAATPEIPWPQITAAKILAGHAIRT